MGYTHILTVREDGIRNATKPDNAQQYRDAVGTAVIKLCLNPDKEVTPEGIQPVMTEAVLNHGNCIRLDGTLHSNDEQVFIWAGNGLQKLDELDEGRLEEAKRLFDALYEKRRNRIALH